MKGVSGTILMLFLTSVLMLASNIQQVRSEAITQISIVPPVQTVGQESVPLPTSSFTINITIDNAVDLYAWQIVLYYNSTILTYDSTFLPRSHVFDGKEYSLLGPTLFTDAKGKFIILGALLLGLQSRFSGSGTLCQIKFVGKAIGTSLLELDVATDPPPAATVGYFTYLLDSNLNKIPISIANGQVTVVGSTLAQRPSSITINPDQGSVRLGFILTVSGDINVTRAGLHVTISHRTEAFATWDELATVPTDVFGHYVYFLNTTYGSIGVHELKASWEGDIDYKGAESSAITITIFVKMPGDVNTDGKVDIRDLALAAYAFGSYPYHPRWNFYADENEDGKVDMRDLVLIVKNFGIT